MRAFAAWLIGRATPYVVLGLALGLTLVASVLMAFFASEPEWDALVVLAVGVMVSGALFAIARAERTAQVKVSAHLDRARQALDKHNDRLRILSAIDRAIVAGESPEAIAGATIQLLRELLGVPRAIVNLFDLAKGEVEWLAAAGRRRTHVGPGVRYSIELMGDVEELKEGRPQIIDTYKLPAGPDKDALLASGVELYMAVPMIAGGELIGAISFGGPSGPFPPEQVGIATEMAAQLAIVVMQARLKQQVKRHADDLERRVRERTWELSAAQERLQKSNVELIHLTSDLRAANAELESFSYSVSHDLRAPLRHVDGYGQLLLEECGDSLDDKARRYLDSILKSTHRMGELIDDLLQLSRVSRGELHREPVDLSEMAGAVLGELRNAEPGRKVRFEIESGLIAQSDRHLVRVVLDNLLGNSWKFTSKTQETRIAFGARAGGSVPVYFVRDNGVGFDMRHAVKLFGAFQRLHTEEEFSGTGIGLATVHRVVVRHGGRVWAEGVANAGATFFFTLEASPVERRR